MTCRKSCCWSPFGNCGRAYHCDCHTDQALRDYTVRTNMVTARRNAAERNRERKP